MDMKGKQKEMKGKWIAESTCQYYFVLQSLYTAGPSTTSYYKDRTKYVPVLLRTTKLAQSTSQYYFVLQNLHKVLPRCKGKPNQL